MEKLKSVYYVLPPLLVAYGLILTIAQIADLRNTGAGMDSSLMTEVRITYLASLVRCFYDLFWMAGLAALVTAANKYLESEAV